MWIRYQPNPVGRKVGDCVVRALSKALKIDWETAFDMLADAARDMGDMPSSDSVLVAVLRQEGFYRSAIPNTCPDCYTVRDFCIDNPRGTFVLFFGGHVATVVDGNLYDAWDSSMEIPQFVCYRKE